MSELADDLRSTGEAVADDAPRLRDIEGEKAALDTTDARFEPLSDEAHAIAERLEVESAVEVDLAARARDEAK